MTTKKHLIVLVLRLLETESDEKHPLTQTKIAKVISGVYPCDRKTVCRNIRFLRELGYPIVKTNTGFYMDRKRFSLEEIAFVTEAVLEKKDLPEEERRHLAERVAHALSKDYRRSGRN